MNANIKSTRKLTKIVQLAKYNNFGEKTVQMNRWNLKFIHDPIKLMAENE